MTMALLQDRQSCATCRFFRPGVGQIGLCRKTAPTAVALIIHDRDEDVPKVVGDWPSVNSDDWCGEWEARR